MSRIKRRKLSCREERPSMTSNSDTNSHNPVTLSSPVGSQEIAFTFDTTSSMNPCITQVRAQLKDIIRILFSAIPSIRIAVFAHGDYPDASTSYVTKFIDFTEDADKLCDFVGNVSSTGICGEDKCYELVLNQVRTQLSWSPGTQRILVVIGDGCPHPPSYQLNKDNIDWEKEIAALKDIMRVKIYSVMCRCQCLDIEKEKETKHFYSHLAESTGGTVLQLHNLSTIIDTMKGLHHRDTEPDHLEVYQREVRMMKGL